ncbi:hypothetical protein WJX79_000984 [Trebouxia sp. C0005]
MDSPRSSSGSPHRRNNMQNYSLDDSAEDPILSNGQQRAAGLGAIRRHETSPVLRTRLYRACHQASVRTIPST